MVDGVDVREWRQKALRDRVAVAAQKSELFSRSIRENIAWGDPGASEEALRAAAKAAQADGFISAGSIDNCNLSLYIFAHPLCCHLSACIVVCSEVDPERVRQRVCSEFFAIEIADEVLCHTSSIRSARVDAH